jgi:hypothetical protein
MSRWYANRGRRHPARLLAAFALAVASAGVAPIGASDRANPVAALPVPSPAPAATPETGSPLLMYDVRLALEQMERRV